MSALSWIALLVGWFTLGSLAGVVELLRRELRELRWEFRDWRHELPASGTRKVRE